MYRYTIFKKRISFIFLCIILGLTSCASSSETPTTLSRKFCSCAKTMTPTAAKLEKQTELSPELVAETSQNIQGFVHCLGGQEIWQKIFNSANKTSTKTLDLIKEKCPKVWQSYQQHYNLK
ncbi:MAG: hypothetical protein MK212_04800 [Saprospiraceae bacterium]|nr:hypothetical protein [Saprospiraceae bacterium]